MALKLDRLNIVNAIVDAQGRPTPALQLLLQNAFKSIEGAINALADTVAAIQAAQDAADAANQAAKNAQTAADNAQGAANDAQNAADQASGTQKLASSGVIDLVMEAIDAGADATINISAHTRIYGDGTSVAVDGGTLTGLAYSTAYYVFYDDPGFAGGAVTYQTSTNPADAVQTGSTHSLGAVRTPAAAGAPSHGVPVTPPGVAIP